jgi:CubicO group peptidase (beta-lactamase class C family)
LRVLKQLALAALALVASATACPLAAKLVETTIEVPVEVRDAQGQIVRQPIKVTIFRDDARPRAPFMILNHGRSAKAVQRAGVKPAQYAANARYFVSRGYAVFMPVRIGYGASGGADVENSGPCAAKAYRRVYEAGTTQSLSVIEFAKAQPYVDPARGIVVGQSFGGTITIALAARNVPGVLAGVNFAGGGGGRPDTHPEQPCSVERMTQLFASYGATARIPTLWVYSRNDKFWGPELPRVWHKAFTDRGGMGEFVSLPEYKSDGHPSFTGAPEAWKPAFEAFLKSCCTEGKRSAAPEAAEPVRPPDTPEAFTRTLAAWAARHKVEKAVIIVRRGGRVVHQAGIGGADPSSPVLLASLSKAITGACIATLVRDGRLGFDWPLSKALAKHFAAHGRPKDQRIERITIAQLLTHRAGFASAADGEDSATRSVLEAYLGKHSTREAPKPVYITMLLGETLLRDPGETFAYSNAGYMLLGAVIEEATGQAYEQYCREAVLKPVGAAGALDPTWGVLWATGGWRMAGADYLAFLDQHDPDRATWGSAVRSWTLDPTAKTFGPASPKNWYGPGIRIRDAGRGLELWHTGTWRRRLPPDAQGPRAAETSLLAVRIADGTSWFIHSTPLVLDGARNELDRELLTAYRSIRRW